MKFAYLYKLDKIFENSSWDTRTVVIISNASIKNNITTSIVYIHSGPNIIAKTIHHAVNVTLTETELFAIRYKINQVINILHIIVITDTIHLLRYIFNSLSHPYQLQSIVITQDLGNFFEKNTYNSIKFWDCPNNAKWIHYSVVDKETKRYNLKLIFLCKSS